VELDAPRAFQRWLANNRRALTDLLERGTWLDRHDAAALLDLTIPGVDELAGLIEISVLARGPFDRVVVDTAPTGHTLRLLAAPAAVSVVAGVLDALQEDDRIIRERLARVARSDAADALTATLAQQAAEVALLLRDPCRTSFHWITLPEALSVAESADALKTLDAASLPVAELIVNRVWPRGPSCPICDPRRRSEQRVLRQIRTTIAKGRRVRVVHDHTRDTKVTKGTKAAAKSAKLPSADLVGSAQLVFVGGKGGVGKTTVAAAVAVRVARAQPERSVLLLSTDPAHSLADVFDAPLGDDERTVAGGPRNLVVRELDAARALAERRGAIESALNEVEGAFAGAAAAQASRLMELAPPGVDELFGVVSILDALSRHSVVVVDTAPTGHMLRLLEMPDAAREWVRMLLRLLLKYKAVMHAGRFGAELVEASQSIRALQALLRDAARTRFLVVTRAERTVRAETERLLRRLRALQLFTPAIVVNARVVQAKCRLCRAAAAAEQQEMRAVSRFIRSAGFGDCAIIETPVAAPPPRGAAALERWTRRWER
jgi:arsenite/tail-anchored protein-transporting ATPase